MTNPMDIDGIETSNANNSKRVNAEIPIGTDSQRMYPPMGMSRPFMVPAPEEKPEKFRGANFKRWQQKMLFYLTTLNLVNFLKESAPVVDENETDTQKRIALDQWTSVDYLCKNYILSGLSDALYNVYLGTKTSKELWDSLEKEYKAEDAGTKKYAIEKYLEFMMVDSKSVVEQMQQFQLIVHEILSEGIMLPEAFVIGSVIEKLPPLWKDFKCYLKHKRKEMSLENLIVKLRIEEDNRKIDDKFGQSSMEAKANLTEHRAGPSKKRKMSDDKGKKQMENSK